MGDKLYSGEIYVAGSKELKNLIKRKVIKILPALHVASIPQEKEDS